MAGFPDPRTYFPRYTVAYIGPNGEGYGGPYVDELITRFQVVNIPYEPAPPVRTAANRFTTVRGSYYDNLPPPQQIMSVQAAPEAPESEEQQPEAAASEPTQTE